MWCTRSCSFKLNDLNTSRTSYVSVMPFVTPPLSALSSWVGVGGTTLATMCYTLVKPVWKQVKALAHAYNCCVNASLLFICPLSVFITIITLPTYFDVCRWTYNWSWIPRDRIQVQEEKFGRCLFTFSIKRKIRHSHVEVRGKTKKKDTKKCDCDARAKFLFCLSKFFSLTFSLPSRNVSYEIGGVTWTHMLGGKANGLS